MIPNYRLMAEKGLSEERQELLTKAYSKMDALLQRPQHFARNGAEALMLVKSLEGHIQILWDFDFDPKFWYMDFHIKSCTCPTADNLELCGTTTERIYNRRCPIHGENNTEEFT